MERRLAAIMICDIAGYSRLMERADMATLIEVKRRRSEIWEPAVRDHRGRIVKEMGDGLLAEFPSAVQAVAAALRIQREMSAANAAIARAEAIELRIGITLGDVIGEGEDIFGEGVNIAARLEALSEPGGIAVSGKIFEEVEGKLDCAFEDAGEQTVKNVSRPVRVYHLLRGAAPPTAPLDLPDKPSIVVLPFQNLSGDPEQEYFADGIVEDITTALSRFPWLFVIARNSSFTYKGRAVNVKQVGRELGVRYVLEGSVRRSGERVRITGQLIDAATGAHLWADRFDGDLADLFQLQDEVTQRVVGWIAPKLEQVEMERARRKPTERLDAYDYYLRGMAAFYQFNQDANQDALRLFRKAIEIDPYYAAAHGMAARCFLQRKGFGFGFRDSERAEAERHARRATELGRDDPVALCAAGFTLVVVCGNLDEGPPLIDLALELNPNLGWAWHFSALTQAYLGNSERALEHAARAMRLSPQDPHNAGMHVASAFAHYQSRRYEEALVHAEAALTSRPNFLMACCVAAASAAMADRHERARHALDRLRALDPGFRLARLDQLVPFRRQEDFAHWAEGLRRAGVPE